MQIQFNDEPMQCADGLSVIDLLTQLNQLKTRGGAGAESTDPAA
ncbi:sulfur carrier protein ThiS [Citrobacter koseri]|uniref:Sulfur carrier protein ThiS n=1 Tax=Citrobacter koseri TaxID=545 RepID=A0A2X2YDC8_CITKO|nr:sulfur carrier protein ThiS [Citrobacter koseri]